MIGGDLRVENERMVPKEGTTNLVESAACSVLRACLGGTRDTVRDSRGLLCKTVRPVKVHLQGMLMLQPVKVGHYQYPKTQGHAGR